MGRQRRSLLADLPGSLDVCCHDIFSLHVAHQDVHLDVVPKIVPHRQLQVPLVDVCVLYYGIWFGSYLLQSICLCAC